MKKEWTEQDLREFVRNAQAAFEDVTLTEADEESARSWQDDGLMVDYELRNGQVDCVLRRQIVADGKVWQLQMTAPLAGNDLPEDRMTPREKALRPPGRAGGLPPDGYAVCHRLRGQDLRGTGRGAAGHLRGNAPRVRGLGGPDAPGGVHPVHWLCLYRRSPVQKLGCAVQAL